MANAMPRTQKGRTAAALLQSGNLPFEASHLLLLLLDGVERPLEAAHPAAKGLLFGLEPRSAGEQLGVTSTYLARPQYLPIPLDSLDRPAQRCDIPLSAKRPHWLSFGNSVFLPLKITRTKGANAAFAVPTVNLG
jgi:hypothetical protein